MPKKSPPDHVTIVHVIMIDAIVYFNLLLSLVPRLSLSHILKPTHAGEMYTEAKN